MPTLQFEAIWVIKGCPAPACILSPLPRLWLLSAEWPWGCLIYAYFDAFGQFPPWTCAKITIQSNMGAKRLPGSRLYSQPPALPPYSCQQSDPGDVWYMLFRCISTLSTLNVYQHYNSKQNGCLKGAHPPSRILSPPAKPLSPISIVTLGMLDICRFRRFRLLQP